MDILSQFGHKIKGTLSAFDRMIIKGHSLYFFALYFGGGRRPRRIRQKTDAGFNFPHNFGCIFGIFCGILDRAACRGPRLSRFGGGCVRDDRGVSASAEGKRIWK